MKYWTGYLTAGIIGAITWALMRLAENFGELVDMVYPYVTRMLQGVLAEWSAGVAFCLWQVIAIALVVGILATVVLMIVFRWNFIQWLGWVTALASILLFCHTALYGLNGYAGSISQDIRLEMSEYTQEELENATMARDLPGMADVDTSLLLFSREIRKDVKVNGKRAKEDTMLELNDVISVFMTQEEADQLSERPKAVRVKRQFKIVSHKLIGKRPMTPYKDSWILFFFYHSANHLCREIPIARFEPECHHDETLLEL